MGTTTFFLRHNDLGKLLNKMAKKELEKLNNLSPYDSRGDGQDKFSPAQIQRGQFQDRRHSRGRPGPKSRIK